MCYPCNMRTIRRSVAVLLLIAFLMLSAPLISRADTTSNQSQLITLLQQLIIVLQTQLQEILAQIQASQTTPLSKDPPTPTVFPSIFNQPPAPTCTFSANPRSITAGQSATLSWASSNATAASISSLGSTLAAGVQTVSPLFTTLYFGTFTGPGGKSICSAIVSVTSVAKHTATAATTSITGISGTFPPTGISCAYSDGKSQTCPSNITSGIPANCKKWSMCPTNCSRDYPDGFATCTTQYQWCITPQYPTCSAFFDTGQTTGGSSNASCVVHNQYCGDTVIPNGELAYYDCCAAGVYQLCQNGVLVQPSSWADIQSRPKHTTNWCPQDPGHHTLSDIRVKEDVIPIRNALDKLSQLNGIFFNWKDSSMPQGQQMGVIAQEVQKVFPEAVIESNGVLYVNYYALIAPIIEGMKELKLQNDLLLQKLGQ